MKSLSAWRVTSALQASALKQSAQDYANRSASLGAASSHSAISFRRRTVHTVTGGKTRQTGVSWRFCPAGRVLPCFAVFLSDRLQHLDLSSPVYFRAGGEAEAVQLPCADARVVCHLPALNTHTLTVSSTGAAPTLQTSTEQLLHLVSHLQSEVSPAPSSMDRFPCHCPHCVNTQ